MPTSSHIPLANVTLTGGASAITFSSITQTYRDLTFVITTNGGNEDIYGRYNGSTTSCDFVYVDGSSGGVSSGNGTRSAALFGYSNGAQQMHATVDVYDYSATDKHKTSVSRDDDGTRSINAMVSRWPSNSAITSVTLTRATSSWSSGTTVALYGVI